MMKWPFLLPMPRTLVVYWSCRMALEKKLRDFCIASAVLVHPGSKFTAFTAFFKDEMSLYLVDMHVCLQLVKFV